MGGDNPSVSGNRNTTSTSFSIAFNSGLKQYYIHEWLTKYLHETYTKIILLTIFQAF